MNKPKRANPLWETVVLFTSFVLLWAWFLANQAARRTPDGEVSWLWQIVLGVALLVLIVVTVRRVTRVRRAFSGEDQEDDENQSPTGLPPFPPVPRQHGSKQ
jgi:hypothetical protein